MNWNWNFTDRRENEVVSQHTLNSSGTYVETEQPVVRDRRVLHIYFDDNKAPAYDWVKSNVRYNSRKAVTVETVWRPVSVRVWWRRVDGGAWTREVRVRHLNVLKSGDVGQRDKTTWGVKSDFGDKFELSQEIRDLITTLEPSGSAHHFTYSEGDTE